MAVEGMSQVTLYMKPSTYKMVKMVALRSGCPVYEIVNTALERELNRRTTPEERQFLQATTKKPKSKRVRKKKVVSDTKKKTPTASGNDPAGEKPES